MAATLEQTITATKIAKPSIQAIDLSSSSWAKAVAVIILTIAATDKIFKVSSYKAIQSN